MRTRFAPPCRPPSGPHGERWPPHHRMGDWRVRRSFFRRMAVVVVAVLTLGMVGAVAVARLIGTALGLVPPSGANGPSILVAGGLVGAALAALVVLGGMRRFALPLRGVMDGADRVAAGDYEVRVDERGPPAIRALARSFNVMTARLAEHERVRRNLMADVAHELRTPLTVIQGKLEGLLDGVYPRDEEQLRQLVDETRVLSRLVEDLRTLALSESGALRLDREPTDVAGLAREVARAFADQAKGGGVTLTVEEPAELAPIDLDPLRMREVLGNLVSNALRHTPAGGSVTIRVTAAPDGAGVEVRDTGSGMTPEELAHAFDRFYKGARSRGSGLGLAIARSLVEAHGGGIRAESEAGRGTTIAFTVRPPA